MNSKIKIILVVGLVVILGGILVALNRRSVPSMTIAEANQVSIDNFSFGPAELTVKPGTTVTWANQDSTSHQVNSEMFDSPILNQNNRFEFAFAMPGSYDYFCALHPSMTGKIVVE